MRNVQIILVLFICGMCLQYRQPSAVAAPVSYASEIAQDVREDKVYLLEKIRPQITKPSEKILVEALLTEDGPKAARLYRKQLAEYPDPQLDEISRSRLAAYEQAAATVPGLPVMLARASSTARIPVDPTTATMQPIPAASKPDSSIKQLPPPVVKTPLAKKGDTTGTALPAPRPQTPVAPAAGAFTLQFGSFDSITNADQMAAQFSSSAPARVQQINGVYKVRLKRSFATPQEATSFARSLPIESIVVPQKP
ncbi:MAG: SPOR domain-containing protein [Chlorobaculum sp.]|nr:SPOR domain-containing protein [Chlorobaculum sp.]